MCGLESRCVHSFDADTHVYILVMMLRLIVARIIRDIEGYGSDKSWSGSKVEEIRICRKSFEVSQMIVDRGDGARGRWHLLLLFAVCNYFMMLPHRELQTTNNEEMLG